MRVHGNRTLPFRGCLCCIAPASPPPTMIRREFLTGMAAVGLGAVVSGGAVRTARAAAGRRLIDVHSHIIPPFYLSENRDRIAGSRGGEISRAWLEWTPQGSLAAMDRHGVETAMLSLSTPGVWFGNAEEARATARRVNEYGAELVRNHPGRFSLFGAIPLPDTESGLREIEYALDVLKADGIGLLTSYGDKWLGDPAYAPVMDELNRRKAVVYTHPTTANCCANLIPDVPESIIEWGADTTRTIASLVFSGTAARCQDMKVIFSH